MSPSAQIEKFAQSIYLTIKNRYFDDITGEDGQVYIAQVIDWTNMFLDELENEVDTNGTLVDWWFNRESGVSIGTATTGLSTIDISSYDRLPVDENRPVQIIKDGVVVSTWPIVKPKDMKISASSAPVNTCSVVGTSLVFSRVFTSDEDGGTITADVINSLPRLTATNAKALTIVRPKQLLILGVAKNATLPDIVQGGLSPSYVQKFNDLLSGAIARSNATSQSSKADRDDFSSVRGVY